MSSLDLPETCGVMLLPNCTLFPHGGLPLHIFEPRYRKMLNDALEGSCFFAIARLIGEETQFPGACMAPVGTIGLVRASREQGNGTSNLLLHGVLRVRFSEWMVQHPYPYARIEPFLTTFEPMDQAEAAMKTLLGAVEDTINLLEQEVRDGILSVLDRADEPGLMADIICQQFIQDVDLRQELLEMESVSGRIPIICDYLQKLSLGE